MAEFLGMGDRGTARYIYFRTFLLQAGMATAATCAILFWVLKDANPEYRVAAALVVLSIWPSMVNSISAQANVATERLAANLPASVISIFAFFLAIAATLIFKWGIVGVGAAMFGMRAIDLLVRFFPTYQRILAWEAVHSHPPGLPKRMMTFAWQSVASMLVALIVWERSEFFLLKYLSSDIRQIAFYSVAFSLADRLMVGSAVFASASGASIFAQYGRDKSRLPAMTASTFRYLALISIPLHFIAAALAAPALLLLYGGQYVGAVAVVTLAPLLCMPKAFIGPVQSLLQSTERQSYVIIATVLAGLVDIGVAWYLIPTHGAVGACIGSGAAQITAVGAMWAVGIYLYRIRLPWIQLGKIASISIISALGAYAIAAQLPPLWGLVCGGCASLIVLFGLMYWMRVLEPEDRSRFDILIGMLPRPISGPADRVLSLLIRPRLFGITMTGD